MATVRKRCEHCGKQFDVHHPKQRFCSHKGPGNCKDRFHNLENPERLERVGIQIGTGLEHDPDDAEYNSTKDW